MVRSDAVHLCDACVLRALILLSGFFIDNRLYGKANALAAPFDYGAYRAQKVKDKLEAERASHIAPRRKLPKVNAALAARLLASGDGGDDDDEADARANADGERADAAAPAKLLRDERFAALFSDADYTVDETDATYKALHPNAPPASLSRALLEEHYEAVDGDDDDYDAPAPAPERRDKGARAASAGADGASKQPRMFAARGEAEANAFAARQSLASRSKHARLASRSPPSALLRWASVRGRPTQRALAQTCGTARRRSPSSRALVAESPPGAADGAEGVAAAGAGGVAIAATHRDTSGGECNSEASESNRFHCTPCRATSACSPLRAGRG